MLRAGLAAITARTVSTTQYRLPLRQRLNSPRVLQTQQTGDRNAPCRTRCYHCPHSINHTDCHYGKGSTACVCYKSSKLEAGMLRAGLAAIIARTITPYLHTAAMAKAQQPACVINAATWRQECSVQDSLLSLPALF